MSSLHFEHIKVLAAVRYTLHQFGVGKCMCSLYDTNRVNVRNISVKDFISETAVWVGMKYCVIGLRGKLACESNLG